MIIAKKKNQNKHKEERQG